MSVEWLSKTAFAIVAAALLPCSQFTNDYRGEDLSTQAIKPGSTPRSIDPGDQVSTSIMKCLRLCTATQTTIPTTNAANATNATTVTYAQCPGGVQSISSSGEESIFPSSCFTWPSLLSSAAPKRSQPREIPSVKIVDLQTNRAGYWSCLDLLNYLVDPLLVVEGVDRLLWMLKTRTVVRILLGANRSFFISKILKPGAILDTKFAKIAANEATVTRPGIALDQSLSNLEKGVAGQGQAGSAASISMIITAASLPIQVQDPPSKKLRPDFSVDFDNDWIIETRREVLACLWFEMMIKILNL